MSPKSTLNCKSTCLSPVTVVHTLGSTFCSYSSASPPGIYRSIPRLVLGATLLILAVIPPFKHAIEMYHATKSWQINRYMTLFVKDGVLYFILYVAPVVASICPSFALTFSLPKPCKEKTDHPNAVVCTRTLLCNILQVIQPESPILTYSMYFLLGLSYSVSCVIIPRFIIGVRELYARRLRNQWRGMDTGFGVFSFPAET